ncbi:MAG TPA: hypothetical protein ENI85_08160, partial [Deltaproteobacteria bacterium]|nr:hypothetical protein [Deltaproteobacteria bacterium]
MTGTNGVDGTPGAVGTPGLPGGNGGDGGSAAAIANAPGEDNTAQATGGRGGSGGDGGDALSGSGANGGDGGTGGSGGDASAQATSQGAAFARAVATGGRSGRGGSNGQGSPPGVNGQRGSSGPRGGNATATAGVDASFPGVGSSAGLSGTAIATGGDGGTEGVGGAAHASVDGSATGSGPATAVHRLEATARGGRSETEAGDALAEATGTTTHGVLTVVAEAVGGLNLGLSPNPDSGNANAIASGTHTGSGRLIVRADSGASGSAPIQLPPGTSTVSLEGVAAARASGIATGGADVDVLARIRGGQDVVLRDAVSGSTSGRLSLTQILDTAGGPGPVRTSLVSENPGGGALGIKVEARSTARTGFPGAEAQPVILGDVIGRSTTGADVDVEVFASGSEIRQVQLDDPLQSSRILGVSNGGRVSVRAEFDAEPRLSILLDPLTPPPTDVFAQDGTDVSIDNIATGETTGRLELAQTASAADGGRISAPNFLPPNRVVMAGAGGNATNRLTRSGSFEFLTLEATSKAGNGGAASGGAVGNVGGVATAFVEGSNDAGGVEIRQGVAGGHGLVGDRGPSPDGGDASGDFRATTFGDGNAISIGVNGPQGPTFASRLRTGVQAGNAGAFSPFRSFELPLGRGGDATSRSEARAHGDSGIVVRDVAVGGSGGIFRRGATYGQGGNANSWASGIGGGVSSVVVSADATGGGGDPGGDAEAFAHAEGLGVAQADALAKGGSVVDVGSAAGAAHAIAEAAGALGSATADAATGTGSGASFRARVTRETGTMTRVDATAGYGAAAPVFDPANQGTAFITGEPLPADRTEAATRHAGLAQLLADRPGARIEALAEWAATGDAGNPSHQLVELDLSLAPPDPRADLALAIYEIGEPGGAFESLSFQVEVMGQLLGEVRVFDDAATANAYFASLLVLGDAFLD